MKLRKPTLAVLIAAAFAATAAGETLPDAMRTALESNPSLASSRAQVRAVREALPLAWSEALPQVSGNAAANQFQRGEPTPQFFIRESPEYWIATLNTSTLLFGSGRVLSSTRQARAQIATALASYQDVAQNLLLDVTRAYAEVIAAREARAAQEQSLANLQEQMRYVGANVRGGFLTQTDLAQARARVEQARAGLANADLQLVQAAEAYRRLVGHPPGELSPTPMLDGLPSDLQSAMDIAVDHNPALLAAQSAVDSADAAVAVARASGRVRLSLETSNSFYETIDQSNAREAGEDSVSVRLAIPIFSGGAISARTRQQRASRTAAQFDLANTQREVQERVTVSWSRVYATRASLDASIVRLEAAQLAQRGMQREQQAGLRSTIDVLNQEEELLRARVDLARAERDYGVAQRELAASVGRLSLLSLEQEIASPTARRAPPRAAEHRRWRVLGTDRDDPAATSPAAPAVEEAPTAPEAAVQSPPVASRTQSRPRQLLAYRAGTQSRCGQ